MPQSVEPVVKANYVFAFVRDTQQSEEWVSEEQDMTKIFLE